MQPTPNEQRKVPLAFRLGQMMYRLPLRFGAANLLGPRYRLRCVLYHDIADETTEFTRGLNVTVSAREFEEGVRFLSEHYTPVTLAEALESNGRKFARPPVLVTFDDAYGSVARVAAPILERYHVPAVVFVNATTVGNQDILLDNLICYVFNTRGIDPIASVARDFLSGAGRVPGSLDAVFSEFLPALPQSKVREFRAALASAAGVDTADLARQAQINVRTEELHSLVSSGFEIGNHTASHVFCRSLSGEDFAREISGNKTALETMTGAPVRSFSVPYGSQADLTPELLAVLRESGHDATFLVESSANTPDTDPQRLHRVSIHAKTIPDFFSEVEVLPRLRSIRNRLRAS